MSIHGNAKALKIKVLKGEKRSFTPTTAYPRNKSNIN